MSSNNKYRRAINFEELVVKCNGNIDLARDIQRIIRASIKKENYQNYQEKHLNWLKEH